MDLKTLEAKVRSKYGQRDPRYPPKGGFILSNGMLFAVNDHAAWLKSVDCKLRKALNLGICRFFSRHSMEGSVAAFEYKKLTAEQKVTIKKILKAEDFFTVVTEAGSTTRFRPIRSFKF
jgi:hypothetical protein